MTQDKTGGPAFAHGNPEQGGSEGMTLRDWFAGQALTGFVAGWPEGTRLREKDMAGWAYEFADAMLAAREAKP